MKWRLFWWQFAFKLVCSSDARHCEFACVRYGGSKMTGWRLTVCPASLVGCLQMSTPCLFSTCRARAHVICCESSVHAHFGSSLCSGLGFAFCQESIGFSFPGTRPPSLQLGGMCGDGLPCHLVRGSGGLSLISES